MTDSTEHACEPGCWTCADQGRQPVETPPEVPDYPRPAFADDLRDETVFSIPDHEAETGRLVETGGRITVTDFRREADRIYIVGRGEDGTLVSHGFALTRPLLIHSEPVPGPLALWLRAMAGWAEVDLDAEPEAHTAEPAPTGRAMGSLLGWAVTVTRDGVSALDMDGRLWVTREAAERAGAALPGLIGVASVYAEEPAGPDGAR